MVSPKLLHRFIWATLFCALPISALQMGIVANYIADVPPTMIYREPMQKKDGSLQSSDAMTIVDIIDSNPSFSRLSKALAAADLDKTLKAGGPFTLFAPDDKAFAKLLPDAFEGLLMPENQDKLRSILTYHVIPNKMIAEDIKTQKFDTLNGKPVDIAVNGHEITINHAKVVKADVMGSNGVIHVIDTVLRPE